MESDWWGLFQMHSSCATVANGAHCPLCQVLAARDFELPASSADAHDFGDDPPPPPSALARQDSLQDRYSCPLTREVMLCPVTIGCGHSFEKAELEQALAVARKCPVCKDPVQVG